MESIPSELLPRFCLYPASVTALAATCSWLRERIRTRGSIFTCSDNGSDDSFARCVIASDYYEYDLYLRKCGGGELTEPGHTAPCCGNSYHYVRIHTPPYVLFPTGGDYYYCDFPYFSYTIPWFYGVKIPEYAWFYRDRVLGEDKFWQPDGGPTDDDNAFITRGDGMSGEYLTSGDYDELLASGAGTALYKLCAAQRYV